VVVRGSLAGYEDHGSTTERLSRVIVLSIDQLRGVIAANQQLGDLILGAFVARRALLIGLATALRFVGSRLSPDTRPDMRKARNGRPFVRADERIRTADPFITSEVLYQLSYVGAAAKSSAGGAEFRGMGGHDGARRSAAAAAQPVGVEHQPRERDPRGAVACSSTTMRRPARSRQPSSG
jgi:hypothetical protein